MPRRVDRAMDADRTEILNIDELIVLKEGTGDNHYNTWYNGPGFEACPVCGCDQFKQQGRFSKEYRDLITVNDQSRVIRLTYNFYKYQCRNQDCRRIFSPEIRFATPRDNVTHRLEDAIVQRIKRGESYAKAAEAFQDSISRAGIGQIFNRWIQQKEEQRKLKTPSTIALLSGETEKDYFTLMLDCDHGEMRVMDISFGLDTATVNQMLSRVDMNAVQYVLTDCNPTINDAVSMRVSSDMHIIPAGMWFGLVEEDFRHYADRQMKWVTTPKK